MGCDSSILRKKEEPDRPDYLEATKVVSPDTYKKDNQRRKQSPTRGKPPKYRTKIDSRVLAKYDVKALIGKGSFSDVLRVENKISKQPYAVKILRLKNQHSKEVSQSELRALTRIRHPYIIHLVEVFESKECVYLVMELATGGELYERIKMKGHLSEKESVRILQMVLDGVIYLHGKGITHRDLKPENLLFYHPGHDSRVLITDFGFAKTTSSPEENTLFTTWCGTPEYIAPELLCKKPYTNSVDMWAIGVITYVMISGHLPFAAETPSKLYQQIVRAKYSYSREIWKHTTDGAKQFIDNLLQIDPEKRFTAPDARKDAWVNSFAPLSTHKGHSSKYVASQVSGKSIKSSLILKSPLLRHNKFEDESVSHGSHDVERRNRNNQKYLNSKTTQSNDNVRETNKYDVQDGFEKSKLSKDYLPEKTANNHHSPVLLTSDHKLGSMEPSFHEEFPSAAATEDSNSFASRMDESGSEPGFTAKGLIDSNKSIQSPRRLSPSQGQNFALNHFVNDSAEQSDWKLYHNASLGGNHSNHGHRLSLENNGNTLHQQKTELDALFSPLQRSNLRWHKQGSTSFMEKVGSWLEDQNGYLKDTRLSTSSSIIDKIGNSLNHAIVDRSDLYNGFKSISTNSSPIKAPTGLGKNLLPNHKSKNYFPEDQFLQASFSESSTVNLALNGGIFNEHSNRGSLVGVTTDNSENKPKQIEAYQLERRGYNDNMTSY